MPPSYRWLMNNCPAGVACSAAILPVRSSLPPADLMSSKRTPSKRNRPPPVPSQRKPSGVCASATILAGAPSFPRQAV